MLSLEITGVSLLFDREQPNEFFRIISAIDGQFLSPPVRGRLQSLSEFKLRLLRHCRPSGLCRCPR